MPAFVLPLPPHPCHAGAMVSGVMRMVFLSMLQGSHPYAHMAFPCARPAFPYPYVHVAFSYVNLAGLGVSGEGWGEGAGAEKGMGLVF